jgi:DNA-binding MarR family transcriptional regulator
LKKSTAKKPAPRASVKASNPWQALSRNGTGLNVDEFLTFRLTRLSNALRTNLTKRYLEEFGLSLPEWRLLALVTRFSPLRFSELTSRSSMDKGQVSRTLRSAQAKGYVATELVTQDRRSEAGSTSISRVVVTVTPAGREIYEKVMPVAQRYQMGLLELMNPDERRVMLDVLQRLYRHLMTGTK